MLLSEATRLGFSKVRKAVDATLLICSCRLATFAHFQRSGATSYSAGRIDKSLYFNGASFYSLNIPDVVWQGAWTLVRHQDLNLSVSVRSCFLTRPLPSSTTRPAGSALTTLPRAGTTAFSATALLPSTRVSTWARGPRGRSLFVVSCLLFWGFFFFCLSSRSLTTSFSSFCLNCLAGLPHQRHHRDAVTERDGLELSCICDGRARQEADLYQRPSARGGQWRSLFWLRIQHAARHLHD